MILSRFLSMMTLPLRRIFTSPILILALSVFTFSVLEQIHPALYGAVSALASNIRYVFASREYYDAHLQLNIGTLFLSGVTLVFVLWWGVIALLRWVFGGVVQLAARHSVWVGEMVALQRGRKARAALDCLHAIRPDAASEYDWVKRYVYYVNARRGWLLVVRDAAIDFGMTLAAMLALLGVVQLTTPVPALDWGLGIAKVVLRAVGL